MDVSEIKNVKFDPCTPSSWCMVAESRVANKYTVILLGDESPLQQAT
jgi:hypothetical protein